MTFTELSKAIDRADIECRAAFSRLRRDVSALNTGAYATQTKPKAKAKSVKHAKPVKRVVKRSSPAPKPRREIDPMIGDVESLWDE